VGPGRSLGSKRQKGDHVHGRCAVGAGYSIAIARDRSDGPRACDENAVLSQLRRADFSY
jgi:hypothetical protein